MKRGRGKVQIGPTKKKTKKASENNTDDQTIRLRVEEKMVIVQQCPEIEKKNRRNKGKTKERAHTRQYR
jgi:hypothetical protein